MQSLQHNPGVIMEIRVGVVGAITTFIFNVLGFFAIEETLRITSLILTVIIGVLTAVWWATKLLRERKETLKAWRDVWRGK